MAKNNTEGFSKEPLDQLLAGRDPKTALDSSGLIGDLKKALAERMRHAWLMCERSPPHGSLLELPIYVGDTQETRKLKGPRGCPRDSEQRSFWTEQFKLGKRVELALPRTFVTARRLRPISQLSSMTGRSRVTTRRRPSKQRAPGSAACRGCLGSRGCQSAT
jgi:hypothetical protein